jgi:hypothetical protein
MVKPAMTLLRFRMPGYEHALNAFINELFDGIIALNPILRDIPRAEPAHAGPRRNIVGSQTVDEIPIHLEQITTLHNDVTRLGKIDEFITSLYEVGMYFQDQMEKQVVEAIVEHCEQAGTAFHTQGRPITWDMVLESIEATDVRFDASGMMAGDYSIMITPEMAAALAEVPRPEDFIDRANEILRKKWEAYLAQKRPRQLSG